MQPIHELLDRLRWDPELAAGEYALGYYDRILGGEKIVAFRPRALAGADPDRPRTFSFQDENGIVHHIPLHRVRTVYRNGTVIWQRRQASAR